MTQFQLFLATILTNKLVILTIYSVHMLYFYDIKLLLLFHVLELQLQTAICVVELEIVNLPHV